MKFGEAYGTKNKRVVYPLHKGKDGKVFCFNQSTGEAEYFRLDDLTRNPSHDMKRVSEPSRLPSLVNRMVAVLKVAQEDYKQRLKHLLENSPSYENTLAIKEMEMKVDRIDDLAFEAKSFKGQYKK